MSVNSSSDLFTLPGGPTVPVEAVLLGLRIENQGWALVRQGEKLVLQPREPNPNKPNEIDLEAVKRWRHHLLLVVDYVAPTIPCFLTDQKSEHKSEHEKTNKSEHSEQELF